MWSIVELVVELLVDDAPKQMREQRDRLRARSILRHMRKEDCMDKACGDGRFQRALIEGE